MVNAMASKWKAVCDQCSGKGIVPREQGKDVNGNTSDTSFLAQFPALCPKCTGSGLMADPGPQ